VDDAPAPTAVENPRASPAPTCRDGYYSIQPGWVLAGPGPVGGFVLSLDRETVSRGDTLTATLTNVTDSPQLTGNRHKYDIQYRSADGWHTILGTEFEQEAWADDAAGHDPGEGFSWELPLTQAGLSDASSKYGVCSPLESGEYRFIYWGVIHEESARADDGPNYAVGSRFTVSDGQ
jgi:hypothetical protein